jgi:hypothetical protein
VLSVPHPEVPGEAESANLTLDRPRAKSSETPHHFGCLAVVALIYDEYLRRHWIALRQ